MARMEIGEEERQRRGGACLVQRFSARTARSDDERTPRKKCPHFFLEARSPLRAIDDSNASLPVSRRDEVRPLLLGNGECPHYRAARPAASVAATSATRLPRAVAISISSLDKVAGWLAIPATCVAPYGVPPVRVWLIARSVNGTPRIIIP